MTHELTRRVQVTLFQQQQRRLAMLEDEILRCRAMLARQRSATASALPTVYDPSVPYRDPTQRPVEGTDSALVRSLLQVGAGRTARKCTRPPALHIHSGSGALHRPPPPTLLCPPCHRQPRDLIGACAQG
jgi:hypothetical protein